MLLRQGRVCSLLTGLAEQLSERSTRALRTQYSELASPQMPVCIGGCIEGPAATWRRAHGLSSAGSFGAEALAELAEAAY